MTPAPEAVGCPWALGGRFSDVKSGKMPVVSEGQVYRDVLNVGAEAGPEEIRKAYIELVHLWHPDRYAHNPLLRRRAEAAMEEINLAYERLQAAHLDLLKGGGPSFSGKTAPRLSDFPGTDSVVNKSVERPSALGDRVVVWTFLAVCGFLLLSTVVVVVSIWF